MKTTSKLAPQCCTLPSTVPLWSGIEGDHRLRVIRSTLGQDTRAMGCDDSLRTKNCSTVDSLRFQFAPSSTNIEEQELCVASIHEKCFQPSSIRTQDVEQRQLRHNVVARQKYLSHVHYGSCWEPWGSSTCRKDSRRKADCLQRSSLWAAAYQDRRVDFQAYFHHQPSPSQWHIEGICAVPDACLDCWWPRTMARKCCR